MAQDRPYENCFLTRNKKNILFCLVVRSGDYYLFESDSEEEEEEEGKEEEEPPKRSAFQVLFSLAWYSYKRVSTGCAQNGGHNNIYAYFFYVRCRLDFFSIHFLKRLD